MKVKHVNNHLLRSNNYEIELSTYCPLKEIRSENIGQQKIKARAANFRN